MANAVSLSKIINVQGSAVSSNFQGVTLSGLILTQNPILPFNQVLTLTSATAVGNYFGLNSAEYLYGQNYFNSYVGSINVPESLLFSRYVNPAASYPLTTSAALSSGDLTAILALPNTVTLSVTFDGVIYTTTGIDFSGDTTFTQMASTIQTALQAQLSTLMVTIEAGTNNVIITNDVYGGTVSYCSVGTLANALRITQATGATLIQGVVGAIAPFTRGATLTLTDLATLKLITAGTMSVNFNATVYTISAINLSGSNSFSAMATIIQAALISAGLTYALVMFDSVTNAFTITNNVAGTASVVSYAQVVGSSTLATNMKITQATGAILSQGSDVLTPAANLNNVIAQTTDWATFTNLFDISGDSNYSTYLAFAAWVGSMNNQFVYVAWSLESNLTLPGNTSNLAYALIDAGYGVASPTGQVTYNVPIYPNYGSQDLACSIMGTGASIDYTALNGTISFANKSYSGVPTLVTDNTTFEALQLNGFNFYSLFNARASSYAFSEDGAVGGIYLWLDEILDFIWLSDALQNSIAVLFQQSGKVSNNPQGLEQIKGTLNDIMQSAVSNGVCEVGNTFNSTVTGILKQQAGYDITPILFNSGYVIQMNPATSGSRAARTASGNIWYTNGGSINTITINTVFAV